MPIEEIRDIIFSIFRNNPFKIMSRQKVILGIALLLGLGVLLFHSLLVPQFIKLKGIRTRLFAEKKLFSCYREIAKNPQILLTHTNATKSRLNNLEKKFIVEKELPNFFDALRILVANTQNRVESLDSKPLVSDGFYQRLPLSILVKGNYVNLILLLNKLETHPYLINIKNIKMQSIKDTPSESMMNLELEMYIKD